MYLKNEVAYQDREGTCRIEETPVALAESYSENECDAIYVGLLSENDAEHERIWTFCGKSVRIQRFR